MVAARFTVSPFFSVALPFLTASLAMDAEFSAIGLATTVTLRVAVAMLPDASAT